jgi:2-amino-4-hydroxy-6-hydroxymethyldihydropteridine diphosphokinase
VWLALGSNVGERALNLGRAIALLGEVMQVERVSGVYESEPYGYAEQAPFWNMALRGSTELAAPDLLVTLKDIERRVGRQPTFRMGPRIIDIDIIFFDDLVLEQDSLALPHAGTMDRSFVLLPLLELDETLRHPATGELLAERAARLGRAGIERLGAADELLREGRRT